jgi:hypothetical protein
VTALWVLGSGQVLAGVSDSSADVMIIMRNAGCEMRCPVFNLVIFGDGETIFDGRYFVRNNSVVRYDIGAKKAQALAATIAAALPALATAPARQCPGRVSDLGLTTTLVSINEHVYRLVHDRRCADQQAQRLETIEDAISSATGLKRFLR